ncbi:MAG: hypothetical protein E7672_02470 [Ruminococcaceae bacterium]|nr:hypothetical protein [Oscillospiraceae bacterium]
MYSSDLILAEYIAVYLKGNFNLINNENNPLLNDETIDNTDKAEKSDEPEKVDEAAVSEQDENISESAESEPAQADGESCNDEKTEEETDSVQADENTETTTEEEYDPYEGGRYTTDPDDIAYVAERITGARHSISATAAPLKVREKDEEHSPETKAEIAAAAIVTESSEGEPAAEPDAQTDEQTTDNSSMSSGKVFKILVVSAVAVIVVLASLVVGINAVLGKERPSDFDMSESHDDQPEVIEPSNDPENNVDPDDTDDSSETNNDDTETDTESETETDPPKQIFTVNLDFFARSDLVVSTEEITFGELLDNIGCTLAEGEVPSVDFDYVIAADTTIMIDKITYGSETITESIAYKSEVKEIDTIMRGTKNYLQYGENGTLEKTYTIEYKNGVEQSRSLASENVIKWPVDEIYELGVGGSFVGANGKTYTYSLRRVVSATYYDIEGLTYIGCNADESCIAVDKSYVPLKTILYVKNDKYDFGERIAADIGGEVKEWEIDIWISHDNPQLPDFAWIGYHKDMEIYYIDQYYDQNISDILEETKKYDHYIFG